MSTLPEQFSAARQSQVEAQLKLFQTYTSSAVENTEKIIALNLSTARASMEKSSNAMRQLLAAQDPRDLIALTTQTQENFESMLAYGRELFSIATGSQAALLKQAAPLSAPPQPPALKAESKAAPKAAFPVALDTAVKSDEPKQLDMLIPKAKARKAAKS
ncbi:MAG: phasin family protein [Pseudomonadota bacterium]